MTARVRDRSFGSHLHSKRSSQDIDEEQGHEREDHGPRSPQLPTPGWATTPPTKPLVAGGFKARGQPETGLL